MATIKRFEDLIAWQKARKMTSLIYQCARNPAFARDRGLVDQICRASVSVMSNIAEGFGRGTKQEFINYLFIAKGSCAEVQSQLYIAKDAGYIDMSAFENLYNLSEEVSRLLQSFINKVKTGSRSGLQYKHEPKKKNTVFEDYLRENGLVHTNFGAMAREEALNKEVIVIFDPEGKWKPGTRLGGEL